MIRRLAYLLLLLLASAQSRADDGDWHIYAAYHNAHKVVEMGGSLYVLSDGNLYSYNPEDTSVETYDKATVLSDFGIYDILSSEQTGELVIIYRNGNIDLLSKDGSCYNMPELKMKSMGDKTLNDALLKDGILYLSTNSGIVCVDIAKRAFGNYYNIGEQVRTIAVVDGSIVASTPHGPYKGSLSDNLLDQKNWKHDFGSASFAKFLDVGGTVYCFWSGGLFYIQNVERVALANLLSEKMLGMWNCGDKLYVSTEAGKLYEYTTPQQFQVYENTEKVEWMCHSQSTYWSACGVNGLKGLELSDGGMKEKVGSVIPNSPVRNYSYKLNLIDNRRLLVAGGVFNYSGELFRAGTISRYEDGEWSSFDETLPLEQVGDYYYRNITDIVQDPDDATHHYASAASSGLYEFKDFKLTNHYTYDNSPLQTILPDAWDSHFYVRVTGLAFDSQKNLWMLNTERDTIVRMLKPDKSWTSYYVPEIKGNHTLDHVVFDQNGWAWINSRRDVDASVKAGFLVVNTNGNPGNPKGFSHKFVSDFYNQDGTFYHPTLMNCLCFDLNGALWLGYDKGLFMVSNPSGLLTSTDSYTTLTQVKVPRNDGTNLADYLLNEVPVKCITIDGGNRKWIGTSGMGVYLVSADGIETIAHFTKDNSPLIDDNIYDIAVDGETGEVYIATDGGLCSYIGDATDPVASFDKDLVKVYPNPVRPDYNGRIVIRGLKYDSHVKIVNAAGRLVNEGTSVGGEYTWDGRLQGGKRCASGIYYILATDEEGKNGVVGKFLIVRE